MWNDFTERIKLYFFERKVREFCKKLERLKENIRSLILVKNEEVNRIYDFLVKNMNAGEEDKGRIIKEFEEKISELKKTIEMQKKVVTSEKIGIEGMPEKYQKVLKKLFRESAEVDRKIRGVLTTQVAILSDKRIKNLEGIRSPARFYKKVMDDFEEYWVLEEWGLYFDAIDNFLKEVKEITR